MGKDSSDYFNVFLWNNRAPWSHSKDRCRYLFLPHVSLRREADLCHVCFPETDINTRGMDKMKAAYIYSKVTLSSLCCWIPNDCTTWTYMITGYEGHCKAKVTDSPDKPEMNMGHWPSDKKHSHQHSVELTRNIWILATLAICKMILYPEEIC